MISLSWMFGAIDSGVSSTKCEIKQRDYLVKEYPMPFYSTSHLSARRIAPPSIFSGPNDTPPTLPSHPRLTPPQPTTCRTPCHKYAGNFPPTTHDPNPFPDFPAAGLEVQLVEAEHPQRPDNNSIGAFRIRIPQKRSNGREGRGVWRNVPDDYWRRDGMKKGLK